MVRRVLVSHDDELIIRHTDSFTDHWTYKWPAEEETFHGGTRYTVTWDTGEARVLVAWSQRHAWGRPRGRIIVFGASGSQTSTPGYPWAEFVETDAGRYAARIPDPDAPRSMLSDGQALPARLAGATVMRADECFSSVKNGPSLRIVLDRDDEDAMIRHAYWAARLRGAIS